MKKRSTSFLIALSAVVLLSASSCTREYVCQCKMTYTGAPGLPEGQVREYPITDSKKNAESTCQSSSKTYNSGGITTVEECDLF
jgi:hypothetical protein